MSQTRGTCRAVIGGVALATVIAFVPLSDVSATRGNGGANQVASTRVVVTGGSRLDARTALRSYAAETVAALPSAPLSNTANARGFWSGSELVVFAGGQGAAFDPVTGRWRSVARPPNRLLTVVRSGSPTWTGRELIFVSSTIGARYDPQRDRWRRVDGPGVGFTRLVATPGHVVVFSDDGAGRRLRSRSLSLRTGSWREDPEPPVPFIYPSWPLPVGRDVVVVGRTGTPGSLAGNAEAASFDPRQKTWRALPAAPISGQSVAAAWNGLEVIAIEYGNRAAAYNPGSRTWRPLPDRPLREGEHIPVAYSLEPGTVLTWGFAGHAAIRDDQWIPIPAAKGLPVSGATGFQLEGTTNPQTGAAEFLLHDIQASVDHPTRLSVGFATLSLPDDSTFLSANNPDGNDLSAVVSIDVAGGRCDLQSNRTNVLPDGPQTTVEPVDGTPPFDVLQITDGVVIVTTGTSDYIAINCDHPDTALNVAAHLQLQ